MRSPPDQDENTLRRVREEAELRRWPAMTLDFHGDGYMTSWGPGVGPWIHVLWRAEGDDLNLLLNALRHMPVKILQGFEDTGIALALAVERSARFWAEVRYNAGTSIDAYDAVMKAGAHILVERLLAQFGLVEVMADAWTNEYRRQVANVNAERKQQEYDNQAIPPSPSRRS